MEYIRGIPVVKVFQQTIYSFKNFHAAIEEYEKFASGYALKCRIPLTEFTVTLNGTFVLLIPVAMFILSGVSGQAAYENVVLDFLFYSLFTPVCVTMMNRIMFASEQLMAAKSAVSRVDEILQEQPLKEPEQPLIPTDASIAFSDVSFAYPGAKEKALDHISFGVPTGKTVALVGASGSGKSTAASLIPRFYDVQSGTVTIGGVNVRNIEKQELMKRVAFVFQNTRLFKDTLLNNIKAARPDATREEALKAAAATAHHNELSVQIKAAEKRMAEIAVLRTHIVNYAKTRETYVAYRKAGYSRKFREEHEEEILLHQAAKNAFDEMGVKKLSKVKDLQAEYSKLLEEKKKTYAEYRRSREEMRELLTAKANVNRLLKMNEEQKKEQEKDHGQR